MNKFKIFLILCIVALIGSTSVLYKKYVKEKAEKELYRRNTHAFLDTIQSYKTKDSLNAASIRMIELKLSEYKKYRASDLEFIKTLKLDKKRLEKITTTQTQTIYNLQGAVKERIVYVDNHIVDTLQCIDIDDKWFDLHGCIDKQNAFAGTFENRDSLVYVEHVIPKRVLGFLWKYGVRERKQEIVSKNPNTKIVNAEYISIRK